jgi:hypothetical protein
MHETVVHVLLLRDREARVLGEGCLERRH